MSPDLAIPLGGLIALGFGLAFWRIWRLEDWAGQQQQKCRDRYDWGCHHIKKLRDGVEDAKGMCSCRLSVLAVQIEHPQQKPAAEPAKPAPPEGDPNLN